MLTLAFSTRLETRAEACRISRHKGPCPQRSNPVSMILFRAFELSPGGCYFFPFDTSPIRAFPGHLFLIIVPDWVHWTVQFRYPYPPLNPSLLSSTMVPQSFDVAPAI